MFDIGLGELLVLGVLALVVFGPDQLPKAAASAGKWVRQLREMATSARKEIGDSAGLDGLTSDLQALRDLHPKRLMASALDEPKAAAPPSATARESGAVAGPGAPMPPPRPAPPPASTDSSYDPDAT